MNDRKLIITAAVTGAGPTPNMSPYVPVTPQQIADEVVRSHDAGAAIAHIHVRGAEITNPRTDEDHKNYLSLFHEVLTNVKSRCNIVCCLTTGGRGASVEQRVSIIPTFKPELCSFNCGSVTPRPAPSGKAPSKAEGDRQAPEEEPADTAGDNMFDNTMRMMKELAKACNQNETKPELEIYEIGMLGNVSYLIDEGYLKKPAHFQFVMGFSGAMPPTPKCLSFLYETARETLDDFTWSALGAGRRQMAICTQAILLGSTGVRVGLEDSLTLPDGSLAKGNAEQVEKIVRIAREFGLEPATPDEARQILGLKGMDKVNF